MVKEYKAYPGFIGYTISWLCVLPFLILFLSAVRMLFKGNWDRTIIAYQFVALLIMMPLLTFCVVMVVRTSLILSNEGITYLAFKLHRWNIFKAKSIEVKSPWNAIREVRWVGAPNATILINTDQGDIQFGVVFRPRVNEEIMQEILLRSPNMRNKIPHKDGLS